MKQFVKLIIGIITALIIISCNTKINEGVVVEKTHHPGYTYLQPILVGKTFTVLPLYRPDTYEVTIESEGKMKTFYIDKETFNLIVIGQNIKIE